MKPEQLTSGLAKDALLADKAWPAAHSVNPEQVQHEHNGNTIAY